MSLGQFLGWGLIFLGVLLGTMAGDCAGIFLPGFLCVLFVAGIPVVLGLIVLWTD